MKTVLITGASGNLGTAVAARFAAAGWRLTALVSPGKPPLESSIETFSADLTDETATAAAIGAIAAKYTKIDAALLLVGGYAPGGVHEATGEALRKMYTLNFETAWFAARPLFLHMKETGGGRIALVGARPALRAKDGAKAMAYALSKSLLFKAAELLNAEGAQSNVVVSVIVPSTIDTPVNRKAMPDADFNAWVSGDEIARILEFAVSGQNALREPVLKAYGNA